MIPTPASRFDRSRLNFFVDLAAAVSLFGMILTGYVLRYSLPPGTNRTEILWGISRHEWGDVHFWSGVILLAVLGAHLVLHWEWILSSTRRRLHLPPRSPTTFRRTGANTLVVLAAFLTGFAMASHRGVRQREEPLHTVPGAGAPTLSSENSFAQERAADASTKVVATEAVNFWDDVYPIIEVSCIRCHGTKQVRGNFRADLPDDYFRTAAALPFVVPGNSRDSPLIPLISGESKVEAHRLDEPEIATIRQWIDAGAKWPGRPPSK